MEPLFENKTDCSQKDYDIFLESYKNEFATSDYIYIIVYIIFFGICIFLAFSKKEYILGIALIAGLCIYLWFKLFRIAKLVEKTKESQKNGKFFVNKYAFYKNFFTIESTQGNTQFLYFKLYKIVETKEYFYIYVTREFAYIVSKDGFIKGNKEEFSKFMKKKVFTKYKNRIKSI